MRVYELIYYTTQNSKQNIHCHQLDRISDDFPPLRLFGPFKIISIYDVISVVLMSSVYLDGC